MLATALCRVLGRPRLVLGLWLLSLGLALGAGLPVSFALHALLDARPAAAALARGEADFLFGELLSDHAALGPLLAGSLLCAALLGWLASAAVSGGLLDALRRPGDPQRVVGRAVLARAAATAPAMLRLWALGLLLRLPLLAGAVALAWLLRRLLPGRGLVLAVVAGGAAAAALALAWAALSVALHYARLFRLASLGAPGAGLPGASRGALRAGLRLARQAAPATVAVAALSAGGLALLLVIGRAGALTLDHVGAATGLLFAWRQLLALLRAVLQLTVMALAVEVVDAQQGT